MQGPWKSKYGTVTSRHISGSVIPLLGETSLRELNLSAQQTFLTAVGQRVERRKTAENVYGTLTSILNKGRKWGHQIPDARGVIWNFSPMKSQKLKPFSSMPIPPPESPMRPRIPSSSCS